jgi:hypothetical protein
LFWGVNLGMVKKEELKTINIEEKEKPIDFFGKINQFISKILDCCKE